MIVKLVYESGMPLVEEIEKLISENDKFSFEKYDEGHPKEKKKAILIKASCGAKLLPFCAIYNDDKELIKGFYSEVGECTVRNISKYINSRIF